MTTARNTLRMLPVYTELMAVARYLPSTQFAVMAGALLISGGLVFAAQYVTAAHTATSSLATAATTDSSQDQNTDWQSSLDAVAASSDVTAPTTVSPEQVNQLVS